MIGTFHDYLNRRLRESSWYSDRQAANEPSYTELEDDIDREPPVLRKPSPIKGTGRSSLAGSIKQPHRLGNDVLDRLSGARPYSAIRPDTAEDEDPDAFLDNPVPEAPEDDYNPYDPMGVFGEEPVESEEPPVDLGRPLGVTDCDYCGEIRSVYDDKAGGKGCASCLLRGSEEEEPDFSYQEPEMDEPAPVSAGPEPDGPDRDRKRAVQRMGSLFNMPRGRPTKTWKKYRNQQYRPLG